MASKNNIFKRFDRVMDNADKGKPYAVYCYKRFAENFSKADIDLIEKFRAVYAAKQDNLVSAIQSFDEKEAIVIRRFMDFAQDLPATKFTGWMRRIFGVSFKDKQKNETKSYEDAIKDGDISSYISKRWREQRRYFSNKSQQSQRKFHNNQIAIIVLSAVSVLILSLDIDSTIRDRYNSNLEQDAKYVYDSLQHVYDSVRIVYNINVLRQDRNREEYEKLSNDSILNKELQKKNREEYDTLRNEYELLKAKEVSAPDFDVIKAKLDNKSWYHPDLFSWNKLICAVLSFIVVIISGIDKLKQHQLEWTKNRNATERLKNEIAKYKFGVDPYQPIDPEELNLIEKAEHGGGNDTDNKKKSGKVSQNARLFVERVETIISNDVDEFLNNKRSLSDFEGKKDSMTTSHNGKKHPQGETPPQGETSPQG